LVEGIAEAVDVAGFEFDQPVDVGDAGVEEGPIWGHQSTATQNHDHEEPQAPTAVTQRHSHVRRGPVKIEEPDWLQPESG
jgi:hypothetical protein